MRTLWRSCWTLGLWFVEAVCLLAFCASSAFAQSQTTGRITGTVKDQNGAVIVGAEITVARETTGQQRKVTTGRDGHYHVPLLFPGSYRVRISARGFNAAVFDPVEVGLTETTAVNAELTVAGVT